MNRFAQAIILSWGWRRRGIAFSAGAVSALAQAPFFLFPLLWLTLPVLVLLIDGAVSSRFSGRTGRSMAAFGTGWWFGFGYFLAGLWWVGSAFLVEADQFGWLMPFAVVLLPAGLAILWGLGVVAARLIWSGSGWRIFALAFGLGGAEWLRGHLFTGFPWNAIGYALTAGEVMMQSASLANVYALSFLAVVIFSAPITLLTGERRRYVAPLLSVAVVLALAAYGLSRLGSASDATVPDINLRIVQPAVDQAQKWLPENRNRVFQDYLTLSAEAGRHPLDGETLVVWPETALPFILTDEPGALAAIGRLLPQGAHLVTGAARLENEPDGSRRVFNSIYLIDSDGTIVGSYDKVHLVPFGEYLPLQDLLDRIGLQQLSLLGGGFSSGTRRRTLTLPSAPPFVPLICYEIIFPGEILVDDGSRPGFILNVTNDAWFGHTPGPYQHLHQARVRAVEEGLPVVRAANTGISAIIDSYGRIRVSAKLGTKTFIDGGLPEAAEIPMAARWGGIFTLIHLLICFSAGFWALRRENVPVPLTPGASRQKR
ncbi:apolipoprotein N-acyltransferase [Rhodopseudomonas julia]|uniref:Apolipoprotein N-acyltransferase n=1 Tax=Rhodopseudomonas julia TaxID=200617 RepID=A0ABU0C6P4_9BRAD|nr:apolipoprotein N-acyltransferase [Rhodopseudomonas julia]MDQ0325310.1 apolipoprotein N-acyltransferase [Rhodopseudomonas julia]